MRARAELFGVVVIGSCAYHIECYFLLLVVPCRADAAHAAPPAAASTTEASAAVDVAAGEEVTPWEVGDNINYDKLIDQFGSSRITKELVERIEDVTGAHLACAAPPRGWASEKKEIVNDGWSSVGFGPNIGRGDALHFAHTIACARALASTQNN